MNIHHILKISNIRKRQKRNQQNIYRTAILPPLKKKPNNGFIVQKKNKKIIKIIVYCTLTKKR